MRGNREELDGTPYLSDEGEHNRKKRESVTVHGDEASMDEFIESTQQAEGYTEDEAATVLEEKLKRGDISSHERDKREGDPEKAKEAKRRLQDSGEFEDAVEALEQNIKLDEADAPEGEEAESEADTEPRPDALTLDDVSEQLGVDPAEIVGRVKVDGETYDVTLEEMAQGYQRTESYTRKTQELAQQRKQYQESLQEADALRAQAQQTLQMLAKAKESELTPHQRQTLRQTLNSVQQERAAIQAKIEQEVLPQEHEKLKEKAGWSSPEEVQQAKELIYDTAQNVYGFEPNELDNLYDHRLMLVAYDAARYRQLQSQAGEIGENIGKGDAKPTLKPGQGRVGRKTRSSLRQKRLNKELSQTGSAKDAAALIEALGLVGE